jgi:ATP-dependent Lon protease
LNIPLDFSETIFVCTANYTMDILEPLLDRIEVIKIDDYTFQEKKEIAEKFIIPSVLKEFGFGKNFTTTNQIKNKQFLEFPTEITEKIIKEYSAVSSGMRGIKRTIEKLIRKTNLYLLNNNIKNDKIMLSQEHLNKFLSDKRMFDSNFLKLLKNYIEPGSLITADQNGEIVKMVIQSKKLYNHKNPQFLTTKNILKNINILVKLEDHVQEALKISIHLVKDKLIDLFNENHIKNDYIINNLLKEYNIWLSHPYEKKEGNAYGLSFYIGLLSAILNIKIPKDILIIGELSPLGNILKVNGLNHCLNRCEFYDIKTIVLPEGNKEEFIKFVEHSKRNYNVHFVKSGNDVFDMFFKLINNNKIRNVKNDNNNIDLLINKEPRHLGQKNNLI